MFPSNRQKALAVLIFYVIVQHCNAQSGSGDEKKGSDDALTETILLALGSAFGVSVLVLGCLVAAGIFVKKFRSNPEFRFKAIEIGACCLLGCCCKRRAARMLSDNRKSNISIKVTPATEGSEEPTQSDGKMNGRADNRAVTEAASTESLPDDRSGTPIATELINDIMRANNESLIDADSSDPEADQQREGATPLDEKALNAKNAALSQSVHVLNAIEMDTNQMSGITPIEDASGDGPQRNTQLALADESSPRRPSTATCRPNTRRGHAGLGSARGSSPASRKSPLQKASVNSVSPTPSSVTQAILEMEEETNDIAG